MTITGWRVKAEDRQEWSRIVEQTKTHPGLQSQQEKEKEEDKEEQEEKEKKKEKEEKGGGGEGGK